MTDQTAGTQQGTLTGTAKIIRKDGTVEEFTFSTPATPEQFKQAKEALENGNNS
jgi:hypothetical protein